MDNSPISNTCRQLHTYDNRNINVFSNKKYKINPEKLLKYNILIAFIL